MTHLRSLSHRSLLLNESWVSASSDRSKTPTQIRLVQAVITPGLIQSVKTERARYCCCSCVAVAAMKYRMFYRLIALRSANTHSSRIDNARISLHAGKKRQQQLCGEHVLCADFTKPATIRHNYWSWYILTGCHSNGSDSPRRRSRADYSIVFASWRQCAVPFNTVVYWSDESLSPKQHLDRFSRVFVKEGSLARLAMRAAVAYFSAKFFSISTVHRRWKWVTFSSPNPTRQLTDPIQPIYQHRDPPNPPT